MPTERFPQRSICRHCGRVVERPAAGAPWGSAKLASVAGVDTECPAAPNPDEGPMPPHEPGVIVNKPE